MAVPASNKYNDRKQNPLFQKLSDLNRELKSLKEEEVRQKLREFGLNDRGNAVIICKRYKQYVKNNLVKSDPSPPADIARTLDTNPLNLKYLVIVDFEATCEEQNPADYVHEVIEFPALLFNVQELRVEDEFHSYCKPILNPKLSNFCVKLTGIDQSKVDSAHPFKEVFGSFSDWLTRKKLGSEHTFSIATDCPWDIRNCLFPQCALAGVSFPEYGAKWIDIRKLVSSFYQIQGGNLSSMLSMMGMEFEGREHCGLDDARNIARITSQLLKDSCVLQYNRFIPQDIISSVFKR